MSGLSYAELYAGHTLEENLEFDRQMEEWLKERKAGFKRIVRRMKEHEKGSPKYNYYRRKAKRHRSNTLREREARMQEYSATTSRAREAQSYGRVRRTYHTFTTADFRQTVTDCTPRQASVLRGQLVEAAENNFDAFLQYMGFTVDEVVAADDGQPAGPMTMITTLVFCHAHYEMSD